MKCLSVANKVAIVAVMVVFLASCSGNDCNSKSVHRTLLGLLNQGDAYRDVVEARFGAQGSADAAEAFASGVVSEVATLSSDKENGRYFCSGKISIQIPGGDLVSQALNFEVREIKSGGGDFQVLADESEINRIRHAVTVPINRQAKESAARQEREGRLSAYADNPPVMPSDDEVYQFILGEVKERGVPEGQRLSDYKIITRDPDDYGYKNYVIAYRLDSIGDDEHDEWKSEWRYVHYAPKDQGPGNRVLLDSLSTGGRDGYSENITFGNVHSFDISIRKDLKVVDLSRPYRYMLMDVEFVDGNGERHSKVKELRADLGYRPGGVK